MPKIDAHQHFWKYHPSEYGWIDENMPVLKKDFLPDELQSHLKANGFDGSIAVQARQNYEENEFLFELANEYPFIKGVVGWVDLQANDVEEKLDDLSQNPTLCGIRHLVQDEPDDRFLLKDKFMRGVGRLKKYDLCYDILIFPRHLQIAEEFVRQFPDQKFVIDHISKPDIKKQVIEPWRSDIRRIARYPNVSCKLSGMVTEANWQEWSIEDFYPYLDVVLEAFGSDRLMIGSDWPVCKLAGEYDDVIGIVNDYVSQLSVDEQNGIQGDNAVRFYNLRT